MIIAQGRGLDELGCLVAVLERVVDREEHAIDAHGVDRERSGSEEKTPAVNVAQADAKAGPMRGSTPKSFAEMTPRPTVVPLDQHDCTGFDRGVMGRSGRVRNVEGESKFTLRLTIQPYASPRTPLLVGRPMSGVTR
jgi:hypothetical protein